MSYPWQNATASLKQRAGRKEHAGRHVLSVAKRHGLIEARQTKPLDQQGKYVIRGKTPRPH